MLRKKADLNGINRKRKSCQYLSKYDNITAQIISRYGDINHSENYLIEIKVVIRTLYVKM